MMSLGGNLHFKWPKWFNLIILFVMLPLAGWAVFLCTSSAESRPLGETLYHPLEMTFVGDVMFGRYKESGLDRNPESDMAPFEKVKTLVAADIAVLNLESALLRDPPTLCPYASTFRFVAGTWAADALADAGFTVASLANNHSYDMKNKGLEETLALLRERDITPVGFAKERGNQVNVVTRSVNGWVVAFIGFSSHLNSLTQAADPSIPYFPHTGTVPEGLRPAIESARPAAHIIVVLAHWGKSDKDRPSWGQRYVSRQLIDMGVDLVIGHHSHRLQGIEYYNGGIIAHSLGDFIFDKHREPNRLTGVLRVRYDPEDRRLSTVWFHPVLLIREPEGIVPSPAGNYGATRIFDRLSRLSTHFGSNWTRRDTHFEMDLRNVN